MRSLLLIATLTVATLAVSNGPSEARDGCGRGYFFDGRRCVPQYARPPAYGPGPYYRPYRNPYFGRPTVDRRGGTISCNVPGYTWQNGACRPYTGR
jgi:hypothetical protein